MTREDYQAALDALRDGVLDLGELVVERLLQAVEALEQADDELAESVVEGDRTVNERYLDLERDCIDLLALQQPVAGDLRFVAASFKILTDLERIGDLATNLAAYARRKERDLYPDVSLRDVATIAVSMLERALLAYEERDPDLCRAVAEQDDEVDGLCERIGQLVVRDLIDREADSPTDVDALLPAVRRLLLAVRDVERVGDHAVNVAARTLYMVEGDASLLR